MSAAGTSASGTGAPDGLRHSAVTLDGAGHGSAEAAVAALRATPGVVAVAYDAHARTVALRYDAAILSVDQLERTVGRLGVVVHVGSTLVVVLNGLRLLARRA
jgi:hypothetical protein